MRVTDIRIAAQHGVCELHARVKPETTSGPFGGQPIAPFDLWYRFPDWCLEILDPANGDPFLAALLVPAMMLGERLEISAPVSPRLLHALPEIEAILCAFDPRHSRIDVEAPVRLDHRAAHGDPAAVGLFFSLGVDSFYSLLKNMRDHPDDRDTITHLIAVHGMDVWEGQWDEAFPPAMLANWQRVARETGKTLLPVTSNVRAVLEPISLWTMAHGAALASIVLALGGFFRQVSVAATTTYDQLYPWGSHPVLDPLWSTEAVTFRHDGCEIDRIGKTALIARSPLVLDTLRVCPGFLEDYNCGRCVKCLPTMIDLLQLGVLERCRTFPHAIDPEDLRQVLEAYRGMLNVEGYRRRHDGFTGNAYPELRAVLADYLAIEDGHTASRPRNDQRNRPRLFPPRGLGWRHRRRPAG